MDQTQLTMAQQIAKVASAFQEERTGRAPQAVTVAQSDGTLVITLYGALSPAEQTMAKSPEGAAKVQESVEYYTALRSQRAAERADVALVVCDAQDGVTAQDLRIADRVADACIDLAGVSR